jgi:hypothetical protein
MMIRTILVAAAALALVSFSPRHAASAEAPWCAVISLGRGDGIMTASTTRSMTATAEAIFWRAIEAFVVRARTTSLDPRNKGRPGIVAVARIKTECRANF